MTHEEWVAYFQKRRNADSRGTVWLSQEQFNDLVNACKCALDDSRFMGVAIGIQGSEADEPEDEQATEGITITPTEIPEGGGLSPFST